MWPPVTSSAAASSVDVPLLLLLLSSTDLPLPPPPPPNYPINISELKVTDNIGFGSVSFVDKAFHPPTGKDYALKTQHLQLRDLDLDRLIFSREIHLLSNLHHPNIIKFFGYSTDGSAHQAIQLLLEYMDLNSLAGKHFPYEPHLSVVAKQILSALNYLHSRNIVHLDINPRNLLLNSQGWVKMADFGISEILDKSMETCKINIGTMEYMSPERVHDYPRKGLPKAYAYAGDIWSFGFSIWELYVGYYPLGRSLRTEEGMKSAVSEWESSKVQPVMLMPDTTSPELRNFIACCLEMHPENRWTAEDLLGHPFITRTRSKL